MEVWGHVGSWGQYGSFGEMEVCWGPTVDTGDVGGDTGGNVGDKKWFDIFLVIFLEHCGFARPLR